MFHTYQNQKCVINFNKSCPLTKFLATFYYISTYLTRIQMHFYRNQHIYIVIYTVEKYLEANIS